MELWLISVLIVALLILVVATIFGLLVYSGLFFEPAVGSGVPPMGRSRIAYKFLEGSYTSPNVGATFTESISISPKSKGIGIFYDNPNEWPEEKLRCALGCVVEDEMNNFQADKETEKIFLENNFKFFPLPLVQNCVTAHFPYTTPFSIWLAPTRVYPVLSEFISNKGLCAYPMIELYDETEIRYMAPLSKQDEFFVPEALECEKTWSGGEERELELSSSSRSRSHSRSRQIDRKVDSSSSTLLDDSDSPDICRNRRGKASIFGENVDSGYTGRSPTSNEESEEKISPIRSSTNSDDADWSESGGSTDSSFEDIATSEHTVEMRKTV